MMRSRALGTLLILAAAGCLWSQAAVPATVLPAGTVIRLRMASAIDSKHSKTGDAVPMEVMRDVKAGDLLVIAKHTPVTATVVRAKSAGRAVRRGFLALEAKAVNDISGHPIAVMASKSEKPSSDRQAEAYTDVVLSMGFFSPILLFVHGDEAELPKGEEVDAQVSSDVPLDPSELRSRMAALAAAQAAAAEQNRTGQATVHFYYHYWPPHHQGQWQDHVVLVDGKKLVRLRQWRFFDAQIAPGHRIINVNGNTLEMDTYADQQYYISVVLKHASGWSTRAAWEPELKDPETGEDEMYPLLPADKKDVYSEVAQKK